MDTNSVPVGGKGCGAGRRQSRAVGFKRNPVGNTGLKLQVTLKIDYLNATAVLGSEDEVRRCLNRIAYKTCEDGGIIWTEEQGLSKGRYYAHSANTVHGSKFAWSVRPDGKCDVWVSLPGKVLARIDSVLHLPLFREMHRKWGFKPTRLDIALDDYSKTLPLETIVAALQANNYVHFQSYNVHQNFGRRGKCGWTVNLGSRQSDKFYRYYDKSAESNGEIDANRLEAELKDFKARQLWDVMMQIPDDGNAAVLYGGLLREVVIGGIDFRDLSADSNTSRCPRLPWWQSFIDHVNSSGGIRLGTSKRESSLQKTVTWIKTQVETSLAMLRDVLGAEQFHVFLRDAIDSGRLRYDRHHLAMLQLHAYGYDELEMIK